jgi:hypothetical protein
MKELSAGELYWKEWTSKTKAERHAELVAYSPDGGDPTDPKSRNYWVDQTNEREAQLARVDGLAVDLVRWVADVDLKGEHAPSCHACALLARADDQGLLPYGVTMERK